MTTGEGLIFLEDIREFLDRLFLVHCYNEAERGGVYLPSSRRIKRFGLVLEPGTQLKEWALANSVDGLFLHRPWKLQPSQLPSNVGVISYHLPFDERLTLGFNRRLAEVLGISSITVLGHKDTRAIGMIGDVSIQSFSNLSNCINQVFGGYEQVLAAEQTEVRKIAVVGAMTDLLVREAADKGADVYITGQLRQPALEAMQETKIAAIAIGHRRSEAWGLRVLAGLLRERWASLEVIIAP